MFQEQRRCVHSLQTLVPVACANWCDDSDLGRSGSELLDGQGGHRDGRSGPLLARHQGPVA